MSTSERTDPYLSYRFNVEIDSLLVAGFSEVRGLEMQLQTENVQKGGSTSSQQYPTHVTSPNLTLVRGMTRSTALWDWIEGAMNGPVERKSGRIILLDSTGAETWGWEFRNAYPVQWSGPTLTANGGQSSVALETLVLTHEGLSKMQGMPRGRA